MHASPTLRPGPAVPPPGPCRGDLRLRVQQVPALRPQGPHRHRHQHPQHQRQSRRLQCSPRSAGTTVGLLSTGVVWYLFGIWGGFVFRQNGWSLSVTLSVLFC